MNNVTFGDGCSGYYETVAGGAGAVSSCANFIFRSSRDSMICLFFSITCWYLQNIIQVNKY